jgi:serine/threonine protein kinase
MVTTLDAGAVVGGHRVLSLLFHSVAFSAYSAVDPRGRSVCLLCGEERATRPDDFALGVAALKELRCEWLPHVLGGGRDASLSWIATEAIGATEPWWAPGAEPLHWLRVLKVAKRVGEALAVAAGAGLRHGSLEPACIRRFQNGRLCVIGVGAPGLFGVDRDAVLNSPRYVAPEQLEGASFAVEDAADIYALGMWMHAALAGREPFEGATKEELLVLARHGCPAIDLDNLVPGDVWELLAMFTTKSRASRVEQWSHAISLLESVTKHCLRSALEEQRDPKVETVVAELLFEEMGRMSPGEAAAFLREKAAGEEAAGDGEPREDEEQSAEPELADRPSAESDPGATPPQAPLPSVLLIQGHPANDARRSPAQRWRIGVKAAGGALVLGAMCALVVWRPHPRITAACWGPLSGLISLSFLSAEPDPKELKSMEARERSQPTEPGPPPRSGTSSKHERALPRKERAVVPSEPDTWKTYFEGRDPLPLDD